MAVYIIHRRRANQITNEEDGGGGCSRQYIQQCVYIYVHGVVVVVETNKVSSSYYFS